MYTTRSELIKLKLSEFSINRLLASEIVVNAGSLLLKSVKSYRIILFEKFGLITIISFPSYVLSIVSGIPSPKVY